MRAGARGLRFQRTRERRHRLQVGALQKLTLPAFELEQVAKVAGVEEQLLPRAAAALLRGAERHAVQSPGQALGNGEQLERAKRLADERVGAGALRCCARAAAGAGE